MVNFLSILIFYMFFEEKSQVFEVNFCKEDFQDLLFMRKLT